MKRFLIIFFSVCFFVFVFFFFLYGWTFTFNRERSWLGFWDTVVKVVIKLSLTDFFSQPCQGLSSTTMIVHVRKNQIYNIESRKNYFLTFFSESHNFFYHIQYSQTRQDIKSFKCVIMNNRNSVVMKSSVK